MKLGRLIPPLVLSDQENAELGKTVRQRTAAHSDVQRSVSFYYALKDSPIIRWPNKPAFHP
jgi:hypothetical protein